MEKVNQTVFRRVFLESGLTFKELARLKIRKEWIVEILEGQMKRVTYKQAARFARAFGVPYKELFPDTRKIEKIIKKFVEVE